MEAYIEIALRSTSVYLFMLLGLRLFGKNELSQLNSGDIVLLLLISNAVQNAMVGSDTSLLGGLFSALVLLVLNFVVKYLIFKGPTFRNLIESHPVTLIQNGNILPEALMKVRISVDELEESAREHGVESLSKVRLAVLEVDGNISMVLDDVSANNENTSHPPLKMLKVKRRKKKSISVP